MREAAGNFVVGKALQLALRGMQAHFGDRRVLASMAVVALLLGVAGPFGTFEDLGLGARLAYWAAIVVSTYGLGYAASMVVARLLGVRVRQPWARVLLFGALTGMPVTLAVMVVNLAAFGSTGIAPLSLWLQCTLIGMGVIAIGEILAASRPVPTVAAPVAAPEQAPPILDRVPLPARGALWALVVQDHYVEIVTERGKALVLMRLGDAIREVGATPGVQIHRSHWVALAAVARVVKMEGKTAVELPDGRRLGISRGYMEAARQAGLLV
jgi:hypothetical protein